jgi:hypothetical protein
MNKICAFLVLLVFPFVVAAEVVTACDVGAGPKMRVEIIRETPIADTYIYLLRQNGKATPIFSDLDNSRGTSVHTACVGRKNRALVLSGEFAANAVQGFVLTASPEGRKLGRLDFAEKVRPNLIYLSKAQTIVVIPTGGFGETSKKYVSYTNATGSNDEPMVKGIDQLPDAGAYEKIDISAAGKTR